MAFLSDGEGHSFRAIRALVPPRHRAKLKRLASALGVIHSPLEPPATEHRSAGAETSHDRIFYVFALPKSASRNVYRTLLKMQSDDDAVPLVNPPAPIEWPYWSAAASEAPPLFRG